jgi:hypothetical protein
MARRHVAFELDVRLKARRVSRGPQSLAVQHVAACHLAHDERMAPGLAQQLNFLRDLGRRARGDVADHQTSKPIVNSSA